jgi:L-ribulose-5-phosphate 3-epimerase
MIALAPTEGAAVMLPSTNPRPLPPLTLGVCSWSLQVTSIAELKRLLGELGVSATQIACGDPHHATWAEGDALPEAALASGLALTGAMLGFPGEDYTTPQTIQATGGFGDPSTRPERLERLAWALDRTVAMGLTDLTLHAGFLPEVGDPGRESLLDTLARAGRMAGEKGVTLAFETGQETALLLRLTLDELKSPRIKVNFDPANMLLYDMGDPIHAVEILGPDIRSVHVKDARRPTIPGQWGEEVPLGQGEVDIPRFIRTLKAIGYDGPLIVEREVGDQAGRIADVKHGLEFLRRCLAEPVEGDDAVPGVHNSEQPRKSS